MGSKPTDADIQELLNDIENGMTSRYFDDVQLQPPTQKPVNSRDHEPEIEYIFKLTNGSEGYDTQIKYLIKGALPANSFGMVYGASGHFKSFHAVSWACCVAAGKDWNGAKVEQGSVVYVVGEGGLGAPRRFRGWEIVHNQSK